MRISYNNSLIIPHYLMCVPSCLILILDRHNLIPKKWENMNGDEIQMELAGMLDLRVTEEQKPYFEDLGFTNYTLTDDKYYSGCNLTDLNQQVFNKIGVPLREKWMPIYKLLELGDIDLVKSFIQTHLEKGSDIMIYLDYRTLTFEDSKTPRGHCMLINDITNEVMTYTSPDDDHMIVTDCCPVDERLLNSMIRMKTSGGLSIIEKV